MGVVLASGEDTRLGVPTAPRIVDGERLVDRAVRVLREGGCDDVTVVLGAWEGPVPDALVVVDHGWKQGLGSSLRIGLKWARATHAQRALVTIVDREELEARSVRAMIEADGSVVQATYDGAPGYPVRLGAELLDDVIHAGIDDEGDMTFLRGRADVTRVELATTPDAGDFGFHV